MQCSHSQSFARVLIKAASGVCVCVCIYMGCVCVYVVCVCVCVCVEGGEHACKPKHYY